MIEALIDIAFYSTLVPLLIGMFNFKHLDDKLIKVFFVCFSINSVLDIIGYYLAHQSIKNHIYYNAVDMITIVFLFIVTRIEKDKWVSPMVAVLFIFSCYNLLANGILDFSSLNYVVIYTFQSIYMAYKLSKLVEEVDRSIVKYSKFWLYVGLILFGFSTISVYIMFEYVMKLGDSSVILFHSVNNSIVCIIVNVLYSKSFLCQKKTQIY
ncbi:MAG: hypothetical protein NTU43_09035 [Bacteroidetes bacterium]|nr:hypothetical protein [Bacteroidota bacterium]